MFGHPKTGHYKDKKVIDWSDTYSRHMEEVELAIYGISVSAVALALLFVAFM